jgi:hypothetical protein
LGDGIAERQVILGRRTSVRCGRHRRSGPPLTPAQRAVSAGGGGRHRLSELVTGARRMRAPAVFASDPTTQPAPLLGAEPA